VPQLPSTLQLDELHGVLQAVFGWTDSHLHRCWLGETAWDDRAECFLCPYDVEGRRRRRPGPAQVTRVVRAVRAV
jgi:hypothetical protein